MKFLLASVLLISCLSSLCYSGLIWFGSNNFHLNDAIAMKSIMDQHNGSNTRFQFKSVSSMCSDPSFPLVLKPICSKTDAPHIFHLLNQIASFPYACEICSYSVCTGCETP
uniref:Guanylin n=1 Tax=Callorhinchus milii TaxID=7868 RepID=A0A4W3H6W5_CALMI